MVPVERSLYPPVVFHNDSTIKASSGKDDAPHGSHGAVQETMSVCCIFNSLLILPFTIRRRLRFPTGGLARVVRVVLQ